LQYSIDGEAEFRLDPAPAWCGDSGGSHQRRAQVRRRDAGRDGLLPAVGEAALVDSTFLRSAFQEWAMLGPQNFDDIAARISKAIENSPAKDIEKNVKAMVASGLARLDVVPRAEFDVQTEVLRKTREKLEALEKRVAEFESRFSPTK
jgi:BMFP domain-containing protein YqiC